MASPIAKGLMWGTLAGVSTGLVTNALFGYMEGEPVPASREKIGACAAALADVATDTFVLYPACEDFLFKRSIITEKDPLGDDTETTIYHLPSASEFPAYAKETKKVDDEFRARLSRVITFGTAGFGFLTVGLLTYSSAKREERGKKQGIS